MSVAEAPPCEVDECIQADYYNSILDKGEAAWNCVFDVTSGGPFATIPRAVQDVTEVCADNINTIRGHIGTLTDSELCTQCQWPELPLPCPGSGDVSTGEGICLCDFFCLEAALDCIAEHCCTTDCGCLAPSEITIVPTFNFKTGCHDTTPDGSSFDQSASGLGLKCQSSFRYRLTSSNSEQCCFCGLMDDVPACMGWAPFPEGPPRCSGCLRSGCEFFWFTWRIQEWFDTRDCTGGFTMECDESYYYGPQCKFWLPECDPICFYYYPIPPGPCFYETVFDGCARTEDWRSTICITKIRDSETSEVIGVHLSGGASRILASFEHGNGSLFSISEDIFFSPDSKPDCCGLFGNFVNRSPITPPLTWPMALCFGCRFQSWHPDGAGGFDFWWDTPDLTITC